uniref:Tissue factor n=1 Tax=Serinus canaria TaxID=9135 RepID=A0A8C9NHH3_SERCA
MLQIIHENGQSYLYLAKSLQIFLFLSKTNVLPAQGVVIELRPNAHPDPYQHKDIFFAETMQVVQSVFSPTSRTCTRKWELPPTRSTSGHAGYTDLPIAVNITWSSINFKTILQWQPKPSGYFYTVEIHGQTSDVKRKCILTSETECDVTDVLRNVKETYTAHILSVEPAEMDNFEEPPFAVSEKFIPYSQTVIGKPEIKDYSQKGSKLNVVFKDPLTPYMFPNGSFLSIQDIFQHDLEYKLYYWKDQSSGKKDVTTKSHNFEVSVDSGKNYCFYVQGIIPSRRENRNGQESMVLCTSVERNILDEYGTEVFIILAVIAVAVITLAIVLPVVLCKRKKAKKARAVREKELLNGV